MGIIEGLSLSMGGGIITPGQRIKQEKNVVNVFIGLGGAGIDCLKEIKTQVYNRVEPDLEPLGIPQYDHVVFLGVDTDISEIKSDIRSGKLNLDTKNEFYHLKNDPGVLAIIENAEIDLNDILIGHMGGMVGLGQIGTGGVRRLGRLLLMAHAQRFMEEVEHKIRQAVNGILNPMVIVHVISGLGGGTGSGVIIDVCYLVRAVLDELRGVDNTCMLGYFFGPEVYTHKVVNPSVKETINQNACKALQELDYCMKQIDNHGSFMHYYLGNSKEWDRPPVDWYHFVLDDNQEGETNRDPYLFAMRTMCEYVLLFVIKQETGDFAIGPFLNGIINTVDYMGNGNGYKWTRCLNVGASCVSLPMKEINTELATRVFNLVNKKSTPEDAQVIEFATNVFGSSTKSNDTIEKIYENLWMKLRTNATEYELWKKNGDFIVVNGSQDMELHYRNQTKNKEEILFKNCEKLLDLNNGYSLPCRLEKEMREMLVDIARGPVFGWNILALRGKNNLKTIISLLKMLNYERKMGHESLLLDIKSNMEKAYLRYKEISDACKRRSVIRVKKRYMMDVREYERSVYDYEQFNNKTNSYVYMEKLLNGFEKYVNCVMENKYKPLKNIFERIFETFSENSTIIANADFFKSIKGFENSIIDINNPNLKQEIDKTFNAIGKENTFAGLVDTFLDETDGRVWQDYEERIFDKNVELKKIKTNLRDSYITQKVTRYFVGNNGVFSDFANKTIEGFLKIIYNTVSPEVISEKMVSKVQEEFSALRKKMQACNCVNILADSKVNRVCLLVPRGSFVIQTAAQQYSENENVGWATWNQNRVCILVIQTGLTDGSLEKNKLKVK